MSTENPQQEPPESGSAQYGSPQYGTPPAPGYGPPPQYGQPAPGYGPPPQYGSPAFGTPPAPGYGPPPQYGQPGQAFPGAPFGVDPYGRPYSDKSKIVAGILQLFLGGIGAGRWYTGHYGIAVAQLLTCGGLGIWSLVDGIMLLVGESTDAQGRVLRA